jgi:hypothetical protein
MDVTTCSFFFADLTIVGPMLVSPPNAQAIDLNQVNFSA